MPEWRGDLREPSAGCWHVVDAKPNSTTSDPVYCRKNCVEGSRYCEQHASAAAFCAESKAPSIGDIIRITKHVYWDGEDCHPPGIIAKKGDIMQVRKAHGLGVIASHTPLTQTMFIEQSEYEFVNK